MILCVLWKCLGLFLVILVHVHLQPPCGRLLLRKVSVCCLPRQRNVYIYPPLYLWYVMHIIAVMLCTRSNFTTLLGSLLTFPFTLDTNSSLLEERLCIYFTAPSAPDLLRQLQLTFTFVMCTTTNRSLTVTRNISMGRNKLMKMFLMRTR